MCIYMNIYTYVNVYTNTYLCSSLGVNSISHEVKDNQELKYFDKSDPQTDKDDENIWNRII